jgi:uncharacterized protein
MLFKFTKDMRRVIAEQRLAYIGTVCPDNTPHLSPQGTLSVYDDSRLMFADLKSPQTTMNLRFNPAVAINIVDPFVRKGYRFKGRAEVFSSGATFERLVRFYSGVWLDLGKKPSLGDIRNIVLVQVERASSLVSPAFERGGEELEIAAEWEKYYRTLLHKRRNELTEH